MAERLLKGCKVHWYSNHVNEGIVSRRKREKKRCYTFQAVFVTAECKASKVISQQVMQVSIAKGGF